MINDKFTKLSQRTALAPRTYYAHETKQHLSILGAIQFMKRDRAEDVIHLPHSNSLHLALIDRIAHGSNVKMLVRRHKPTYMLQQNFNTHEQCDLPFAFLKHGYCKFGLMLSDGGFTAIFSNQNCCEYCGKCTKSLHPTSRLARVYPLSIESCSKPYDQKNRQYRKHDRHDPSRYCFFHFHRRNNKFNCAIIYQPTNSKSHRSVVDIKKLCLGFARRARFFVATALFFGMHAAQTMQVKVALYRGMTLRLTVGPLDFTR